MNHARRSIKWHFCNILKIKDTVYISRDKKKKKTKGDGEKKEKK